MPLEKLTRTTPKRRLTRMNIATHFHKKETTLVQPSLTQGPVRSLPSLASVAQPEWPSPQSQSLSRSYGSILPTSLTYVILSARGFSPWRPAADMGTTLHEIYTPLLQIFKGQRKRFEWHKTCATFSGRFPYLRANRFQGTHFPRQPLNKKRQLSPKLAPTSLDSFVLPHKLRSNPRRPKHSTLRSKVRDY